MARSHFAHLKQRNLRPGWYIVFRHPDHDKPIERKAGSTKAIAEQKRAAIQLLCDQQVPLDEIKARVFGDLHGSRITFREAIPLFLAEARTRLRPSTHKTHAQRLKLLARAPWAGMYLGKITPVGITRWVASRTKDDRASSATVNRDLCVGSALFGWALEMGYVSENPFRRVKRRDERGRARFTWLTPEECDALIEAIPSPKRGLVTAAINTGMRRGELIELRWRNVDLKRGEIEIDAESEKTGRGRVIRLTGTLYGILVRLKADRETLRIDGSDHVFIDGRGQPFKGVTVSRAVKTAARHCEGVDAAKRDKVTFHTLRHTAASLMVQGGESLYNVGKILGHTTPMVTQRYAHLAPDAGHSAIRCLESALERGREGGAPRASLHRLS